MPVAGMSQSPQSQYPPSAVPYAQPPFDRPDGVLADRYNTPAQTQPQGSYNVPYPGNPPVRKAYAPGTQRRKSAGIAPMTVTGTQPPAAQPEATDRTVNENPPSSKADIRVEEQISPDEQPGPRGAVTIPAATAQPGSVKQLNRRINFPRDNADDMDVFRLQIFLDYHGYSPGEIDGQWGYNTERALYVYQQNNGLEPTGQLDDRVIARLDGFSDGYLVEYVVSQSDVSGPIGDVPRDYYAMSRMKYLPYESVLEKLAEKMHCQQVLLRKLNPGVNFDNLQPGQLLLAPNVVNGIDETRGKVAVIRVSKHNKWAEAFDSAGRFMFYFPSTLGSQHDPLPLGNYEVTGVNYNPTFMYQPKLFWDDDPSKPSAMLPPGPNSPVGNVWIGTSRKSVGIHGTPNPENISKNTSHGCIRLTNWDAMQLAKRVGPGTKIQFVE